MRSSTYSVNKNDDDLVSRFSAFTCSGDSVYDIIDNDEKLLLRIRIFGPILIKQFCKGG